ncbi:hypothetical protein [Lysobacter gummosus]|uniref:hypothetical protein n=1 Tax=Lysobacter gummosus TaxID=262324 RepID=UPI00362A2678
MDSTHVMKTLQLWPIVTLDPGSGELVAFDPGPQRTLYTLHTLGSPDHRGDGPASSKHRPVASRRYRAQAWLDGECVLDAIIDDKHHNIHHLQPLGDDLLLACARSHQRGGYSRLNGRVYSRSGELLRELALGDGIEHLQTTARGEIWTGYFDEGYSATTRFPPRAWSPGTRKERACSATIRRRRWTAWPIATRSTSPAITKPGCATTPASRWCNCAITASCAHGRCPIPRSVRMPSPCIIAMSCSPEATAIAIPITC